MAEPTEAERVKAEVLCALAIDWLEAELTDDELRARYAHALADARVAAEAERDAAREEAARLNAEQDLTYRIVCLPTDEWLEEAKALEPGNTASACRLIELANLRLSRDARVRELDAAREEAAALRAERDALARELVAHESFTEPDDFELGEPYTVHEGWTSPFVQDGTLFSSESDAVKATIDAIRSRLSSAADLAPAPTNDGGPTDV